MSTPTITPPAPAAAAPVSTPAPSSPAPASPTASSSAPEPQSALDRIQAGWEQVNKEIADIKAEPEGGAPPAEPQEDVVSKPADEPAAEGEKPAEVPAEGEGEKPAEAAAAETPELDDGQSVSPTDLAKLLRESPELKAFFDKPENQEVKNRLFAMSRRLEQGGNILRMIPSEAEAKDLITTSREYNDFDRGLGKVADAKTGLEFFDRLHSAFFTQGADGKQVANPAFGHIRRGIFDDGLNYLLEKSSSSGDIHPVLKPAFNKLVDVLEAKAKKDSNQDLQAAVDVLREAVPAQSRPQDELTPFQKEKQAELDRRESESNRQTLEAHQGRVKQAFDSALELAAQSSVDQAKPRIAKAGLSEAEAQMAYQKIGERLETELQQNDLYQQRLEALRDQLEKDPSDANAQKVREHIIRYQNLSLGKIISDVLNEMTGGKVSRQAERDQKIAKQVDASRTEPRGVTSAPAGPKQLSPAEERAESEKLWAQQNPGGERMPLNFHLERMNKKNLAEIRTGR